MRQVTARATRRRKADPLVSPNANDQDRANRVPWPPLLYLALVTAAFVLERAVPVELRWAHALKWPGIVMAVVGLTLLLGATGYFKVLGTNVNPAGRALKLATGGFYRYTRNPMYLGGCLLFAGLGLALPSVWLVVLVPIVAAALRQLAILPEEQYLVRRFGDEYQAYRSRVRRWL